MEERTYAPAGSPGPVRLASDAAAPADRSAVLAGAIADSWSDMPLAFDHDGVHVELLGFPSVTAEGHLVVTVRSASDGGLPMVLNGFGQYTWHLPMVEVPDGTWRRAEGVDAPNVREDPRAALMRQVVAGLRLTQP